MTVSVPANGDISLLRRATLDLIDRRLLFPVHHFTRDDSSGVVAVEVVRHVTRSPDGSSLKFVVACQSEDLAKALAPQVEVFKRLSIRQVRLVAPENTAVAALYDDKTFVFVPPEILSRFE